MVIISLGSNHAQTVFEDTGCEVADACLACPLPSCKYDMTGRELRQYFLLQRQQQLDGIEAARTAEIVCLYETGLSARKVADRLGISKSRVESRLEKHYRKGRYNKGRRCPQPGGPSSFGGGESDGTDD